MQIGYKNISFPNGYGYTRVTGAFYLPRIDTKWPVTALAPVALQWKDVQSKRRVQLKQ
jgi:hypothetical protein